MRQRLPIGTLIIAYDKSVLDTNRKCIGIVISEWNIPHASALIYAPKEAIGRGINSYFPYDDIYDSIIVKVKC